MISNTISAVSPAAPGFNNTVDATRTGNGAGMGAQWNLGSLASPATRRGDLALQPHEPARRSPLPSAAQTAGQTVQVPVTARNNDGGPDAGLAVRYTITGVNPGSGAVTTGADGTAVISWLGAKVGTDTLTAFVDRDGNGLGRQHRAAADRHGHLRAAAPAAGARQVGGRQGGLGPGPHQAPGQRARAPGGRPAKGFVPLTGAANIPVGSQLDTSKGRVALTSAADTGGAKTQTSDFYQGIFQVKQSVPKKKPKKPKALITDLVMKGQIAALAVRAAEGRASAAAPPRRRRGPRRCSGKLWGSGKGKFRTNGKYSAATVRGTIWLVQDRCEGTLTKVTRGTVQVRDFKRKKTVTVKAGHSYLARAQRAASKAKRR